MELQIRINALFARPAVDLLFASTVVELLSSARSCPDRISTYFDTLKDHRLLIETKTGHILKRKYPVISSLIKKRLLSRFPRCVKSDPRVFERSNYAPGLSTPACVLFDCFIRQLSLQTYIPRSHKYRQIFSFLVSGMPEWQTYLHAIFFLA